MILAAVCMIDTRERTARLLIFALPDLNQSSEMFYQVCIIRVFHAYSCSTDPGCLASAWVRPFECTHNVEPCTTLHDTTRWYHNDKIRGSLPCNLALNYLR